MIMPAATTTAHCEAVLDEIERVVVGKRSALTLILTACSPVATCSSKISPASARR